LYEVNGLRPVPGRSKSQCLSVITVRKHFLRERMGVVAIFFANFAPFGGYP
jgi:hypothetical protein